MLDKDFTAKSEIWVKFVGVFMLSVLSTVFTIAQLFGATAEFCETYTVEPGMKIEVYNANGDISVSAWDKDVVEVHALLKTKHGEEELKKVTVDVSAGDIFVVKTKYLEKDAKVSVEYVINVPVGVRVHHIETSNGKVNVKGTNGDVTLVSSNGDIDIKDVDGSVDAETANGNMTIKSASGSVEARTSNGDITIRKSDNVLEATTSNGSITAEIFSVSEEGTNLATSNGSIKITVVDDLNADIVMETSFGKVSVHNVPLSTEVKSKRSLEGVIGEGGALIQAKTSMGNVDLYKIKKK